MSVLVADVRQCHCGGPRRTTAAAEVERADAKQGGEGCGVEGNETERVIGWAGGVGFLHGCCWFELFLLT